MANESLPSDRPAPMRAGGKAVEAGMDFQAAVATWFAVYLLVRMPVGGRFGINNNAVPVSLRLETGAGLDDIEVAQSDGGVIAVQCKTNATMGTGPQAALPKTIRQLVGWFADETNAHGLPDLTRNAALIAVRSDASSTLDVLEAGLRAFDYGGSWNVTLRQRNQADQGALKTFSTLATDAWTAHVGTPPGESDLVDLARIFHVARFTMDRGDSDWREAARLLGRHLFGSEAAGESALRDLMSVVRGLIGSGGPADRDGLLRALRRLGHDDVGAPAFEFDVARLRAQSEIELARLAKHGFLPLSGGIALLRECEGALIAAIVEGSLLVVGEPGAGKTGALVHSAAAIAATGHTVVFLSVDRFPGVAIASDLASELGLRHSLIETLKAFPSGSRKILIIDSLDAARGGGAEAVFASLIENVRSKLADQWIVVASIRAFDLKNGRRYRRLFDGVPADPENAESSLRMTRHFLVPRLSESELAQAGRKSAHLASLLAAAPPGLVTLLRNIFNLSLAAQLLADGAMPEAFSTIGSQSALIDAYEDARLGTTAMESAAGIAAAAMANRGRFSVRKVLIAHDQLDAVIQSGVLVESNDLVSFAHHVLFDHVAGRFHLEWDDPEALLAQLRGNASSALMFAPALRFAVGRLWFFDGEGRPLIWKLMTGIYSASSIDPVLGTIALRIVVENVQGYADLNRLVDRIRTTPADPALAALTGCLARFAAIDLNSESPLSLARGIAWSRFASELARTTARVLLDPARVVLQALFESPSSSKEPLLTEFGLAAKTLLSSARRTTPRMGGTIVSGIRFVGKSAAADPVATRALLEPILREPHFSEYADQEAPWLAEQIVPIAQADPEFAVEIYGSLYGQTISDRSTSWLGGQPSRIMPLTTTRQQEYEHCRWHLGTALGAVLKSTPYHGTRALVEALIGKAGERLGATNGPPVLLDIGIASIEMRGSSIEFNAWEVKEEGRPDQEDDLLAQYVGFLRICTPLEFTASIHAASSNYSTPLVWSRILGVATERIAEFGDQLWPTVEHSVFFEDNGTIRDAVRFVGAAWMSRSEGERLRCETMLLNRTRSCGVEGVGRWHHILVRILAVIPENALVLAETLDLRRALAAADQLCPNVPVYSSSSSWRDSNASDANAVTGANISTAVSAGITVRVASKTLRSRMGASETAGGALELHALWSGAESLVALLESSPDPDEQTNQTAWSLVANIIDRIATNASFAPEVDGLPDLLAIFLLLERISSSPYPEATDQDMGWGCLDVRVHAAQAWISLSARFSASHPTIIEKLEAALADPCPTVRMQVAHNLQVICDAAPEKMWAMGMTIATSEEDLEVLGAYLHESMWRFRFSAPERCETVLAIVKGRLEHTSMKEQKGGKDLLEALGTWTAQLFAGQGRVLARTWLVEWADDPLRNDDLLMAYCSALRGAFFYRYATKSDSDAVGMSERAQEGLGVIIAAATMVATEAWNILYPETVEAAQKDVGQRFRSAEAVIHHAANQLYFGAGAHASEEAPALGLPDTMSKAKFLVDYAEILAQLSRSSSPATLYKAIELYEFLVPADPAAVFDAIHGILLGPGSEEDYHFESLANTSVVRIVERYIADYRAIFGDDTRRAKLVAVLQLFSEVGWTEALTLLYALPDLLR